MSLPLNITSVSAWTAQQIRQFDLSRLEDFLFICTNILAIVKVSKPLPDTNILVLICQVVAAIEIEAHDSLRGASKIVLGAAFRGKVLIVAGVLSHL